MRNLNLHAGQQIDHLPIRYSLQNKRAAEELLIAPHHLYLPVARKAARIAHLTDFSQEATS